MNSPASHDDPWVVTPTSQADDHHTPHTQTTHVLPCAYCMSMYYHAPECSSPRCVQQASMHSVQVVLPSHSPVHCWHQRYIYFHVGLEPHSINQSICACLPVLRHPAGMSAGYAAGSIRQRPAMQLTANGAQALSSSAREHCTGHTVCVGCKLPGGVLQQASPLCYPTPACSQACRSFSRSYEQLSEFGAPESIDCACREERQGQAAGNMIGRSFHTHCSMSTSPFIAWACTVHTIAWQLVA